jgi:hypothetical protein
MTPPPDSAPPIVWAVFMGCTTPARLAIDRGIASGCAYHRLRRAVERGWLVRCPETGRFLPADNTEVAV